MKHYTSASNGIGYDETGNNGEILNAHFSYKGRSVIIDYEFCLHHYGHLKDSRNVAVPFEMYPYGDDIYVGHVPVDEKFHKADMEQLLKLLDEALAEEPAPHDYSTYEDEYEESDGQEESDEHPVG